MVVDVQTLNKDSVQQLSDQSFIEIMELLTDIILLCCWYTLNKIHLYSVKHLNVFIHSTNYITLHVVITTRE